MGYKKKCVNNTKRLNRINELINSIFFLFNKIYDEFYARPLNAWSFFYILYWFSRRQSSAMCWISERAIFFSRGTTGATLRKLATSIANTEQSKSWLTHLFIRTKRNLWHQLVVTHARTHANIEDIRANVDPTIVCDIWKCVRVQYEFRQAHRPDFTYFYRWLKIVYETTMAIWEWDGKFSISMPQSLSSDSVILRILELN